MPARPPLSDEARRNIRQTLAQVERELERLTKTIEAAPSGRACSGAGADPHRTASAIRALLATYESLAQAERGLRLLRGLLLQLFWNHGLHHTLGAATLSQFAEAHLGLSERSARALVSEARLFRDEPLLAQAFRAGRIGTVQAGFLRHVALSRTLPAHLRRAERVTVRQLEKETRFLERLADLAPTLWRRHPGPLPDPRLETDLLEALAHRGVNPETAAQELETRGLGSVPSSRPAGLSSHFAEDPAVNPVILARLDALLDLYALAVSSDGGDSEPGPASRNPGDRQTLASRRMTTITFHLPPDILGAWNAALHGLRAARGPLPTWACMVLLVRDALDEWLREDPDRRPTEHAILERDDYACRAPGCSSRSNLEVHHIRFRSQGGTDHAWNKVTLCHAHHHHAVHAGTVRLQGTAPGDLRWEMGTRIDRGSILVTRGDRILRRARG